MTDLSILREQIDEIDTQIVELYQKRMEVCKEVAEYKIETGKKIFDKEREDQKIKSLCSKADNSFNRCGIEELFLQIMAASRKLQYQQLVKKGRIGRLPFIEQEELSKARPRIVFQGLEGAYSHIAMKRYFGEEISNFHVDTFRDAMVSIEEGAADFAVLPIENSSAGSVSEVYDLLTEFENYIVGEQIIKIEHALLGVRGAELSDVKNVYAHPQALMQCGSFLNEHMDWQQIGMRNNAVAANKVKNDGEKSQAAIASTDAAEIYGLSILREKINTNPNNSTRFIIVSNQKIFLKGAKKISISFEIAHKSGQLYKMLSHFIYNDLNMVKIESRPIEDRDWEYRFFVDFEGNLTDGAVKNALRGIRDEARNMKVLGNY